MKRSKVAVPESWRNRIVGYGTKPASEFLANPANWRLHPANQQQALAGAISEVGVIAPVVENVRTGNLLDGHLRITLALRRGDDTEVPYISVDLDEAEEALALATIDPIGAMAAADTAKLDELLRDVATSEPALQAMLVELAEQAGVTSPSIDFPEYDESVEDEVEYNTCPSCGHRWPK